MGFFDGGFFGDYSNDMSTSAPRSGSLGDLSRYSVGTGVAQPIGASPFSDLGQAQGLTPTYSVDQTRDPNPGLTAKLGDYANRLTPGSMHLSDSDIAMMRQNKHDEDQQSQMAKMMFAQMFVGLAKAGADMYSAHAMRGRHPFRGYQVVGGGGGGGQITIDDPLAGMMRG